jgi:hypothetical protein
MIKKVEVPRQKTPNQAGVNIVSNTKVAGSKGTASMKAIEPAKLSLNLAPSEQK